jgi:hypothetical protein
MSSFYHLLSLSHSLAERIRQTGLGIKAATITPGNPDDVGSPNALLRELLEAQVILRTGRRIPAVRPVGGVHAPIAVVRMAVEDAYGAKEFCSTHSAPCDRQPAVNRMGGGAVVVRDMGGLHPGRDAAPDGACAGRQRVRPG